MTEKDIHISGSTNDQYKIGDHNYDLLFHKFFTHIIEHKDGGVTITWKLKKGPSHVQGWVYLEQPKKGWKRKPIMTNHYTLTNTNLNRIHEFMDKYIIYKSDSHERVKRFFLNESIRLVKGETV